MRQQCLRSGFKVKAAAVSSTRVSLRPMVNRPNGSGHIYVATTDAHPGLVKIGFTTQSPERRIRQFSTAAPHPFTLAYSAPVTNPREVEQAVHAVLHWARVNQHREFFAVSIEQAKAAIHKVSEEARRRYALALEEARYRLEEARYRDALVRAWAVLRTEEVWLIRNLAFLRSWRLLAWGLYTMLIAAPIIGAVLAVLAPAVPLAKAYIFSHVELTAIGAVFLLLFGLPAVVGILAYIGFGFDVLVNRHELEVLSAKLAVEFRLKPEDLSLPKDGILRWLL